MIALFNRTHCHFIPLIATAICFIFSSFDPPVRPLHKGTSEDSLFTAVNNATAPANLYIKQGNYSSAINFLIGISLSPYHDLLRPMAQMPDAVVSLQSSVDGMSLSPYQDYLQARIYRYLFRVYQDITDSARAFQYLLRYRHQLKKLSPLFENEYQETAVYLGQHYLINGQRDSTNIILRQLMQDLTRRKDSTCFAGYLHLQALVALKQKELGRATELYNQAFEILKARKQKWPEYYSMALELGHVLMQEHQFALADSVFRRNNQVLQNIQYANVIREEMIEGFAENQLYLKHYDSAEDELMRLCQFMFPKTYENSKGFSEQEEYYYSLRLDQLFNLLYTLYSNYHTSISLNMLYLQLFELQRRSLVFMNRRDLLAQTRATPELDIPVPLGHLHRTRELIAKQYMLPPRRRDQGRLDSLLALAESYERKVSIRGFDMSPDINRRSDAMQLNTQLEGADINIEFLRYNYLSPDTPQGIPVYAALIFDNMSSRHTLVPLCRESQILLLLKDDNGNWLQEKDLELLYGKQSKRALMLYNLLWQPLESQLTKRQGIAYSPVGILNNIAFNALYTGDGHLMDKYRLIRIQSFLELASREEPYKHPGSASIWGNINYEEAIVNSIRIPYPRESGAYFTEKMNRHEEPYKDVPPVWTTIKADAARMPDSTSSSVKHISPFPLAFVGTLEVKQLEGVFGTAKVPHLSYTYDSATEETFKDSSKLAKEVLHISTHGFYLPYDPSKANDSLPGDFLAAVPDPQLRCGLAFSGVNYYWSGGIPQPNFEDGLLTGFEIEQMDLHKVQLVVLSACETGLGLVTTNEGNLGLQRAFKLAGVRYLLVSFWEVPAEATSSLMTSFYSNWLKGESLPDALQHAQIDLRQKFPDPAVWAGFCLVE